MEEIWKDIKGYEGLYQISNLGKVKCLRKENKIMKCSKQGHMKYLKANLYKNKKVKTITIHKLVAMHFIPNNNNYPCINHKDGNVLNNNVENLEWCSYKYNNNYGNHELKRQTKILINIINKKLPNNEIIKILNSFYKTL